MIGCVFVWARIQWDNFNGVAVKGGGGEREVWGMGSACGLKAGFPWQRGSTVPVSLFLLYMHSKQNK